MTTIESVMRSKVFTVQIGAPLVEVVNLMLEHKISGLPVLDDQGNLVGMVTEKDLLNVIGDETRQFKTAGDLMFRELRCFQVTDELKDVCDCLLASNFRRVPIMDGQRLVGLISRADLMPVILEIVAEN